ncbi:MAG: threonine--tRNA ligase [Candidatus Nanoarchaeia archaeon]|nr:threonine--tRNA ligase [Candidatus Nanoarchaeia archaeon]
MSKTEIETIRHSLAHVLAQAVNSLHKKVIFGIGPAIEDGFYYDFDNLKISEEDLKQIEDKMKEIIKKKIPINKILLTRKEAEKKLTGQKYKLELLKDLKDEKITFYEQGDFSDLCKGPHVNNTSDIPIDAFKLISLAGAYWKGDSKNKMLTRIYGIAFSNKNELNDYLKLKEEAEKRDHRKIGKEQELFFFHEYSPGSAFFEHNGAIIYNELVKFIREEYRKRGYDEVITPLIYDKALWETSGHWEHYKDDMFLLKVDNKEYSLKPMNCPSHLLIFKNRIRSYRELPLRIADFAVLHRNELKGVLGGLTRVRKFCQDDAHIFVTENQLENEIMEVLDFVNYVYKDVFKFEYHMVLSTRPEKSMGDIKLWNKAEKLLEEVLKKKNIPYTINKGDGAFYGPKIDCKIKDAIGREWQLATIQLDFQMPLRFEATYEGEDGKKHTPIMIHRAILGSPDRFMGVLIEHCAGKFPLWLSPKQVIILPIADRHIDYAKEIKQKLFDNNIRVEIDSRNESISKKVRDAQIQKVPIMVTIGDKEIENKTLAIRTLDGKVSFGVKLDAFINQTKEEIDKKVIK